MATAGDDGGSHWCGHRQWSKRKASSDLREDRAAVRHVTEVENVLGGAGDREENGQVNVGALDADVVS
ncbi:hypothetical protein QYF36_008285 [Acer negundo]|nr:hypothetical protein QYF36_008285 [Acer negundo]